MCSLVYFVVVILQVAAFEHAVLSKLVLHARVKNNDKKWKSLECLQDNETLYFKLTRRKYLIQAEIYSIQSLPKLLDRIS